MLLISIFEFRFEMGDEREAFPFGNSCFFSIQDIILDKILSSLLTHYNSIHSLFSTVSLTYSFNLWFFFLLFFDWTRQGHHKCREQWPDNSEQYERAFNLFLDVILLILPLIMLSYAYFSITRTLWQGMATERTTKRYVKSTRNDNYQHACKY